MNLEAARAALSLLENANEFAWVTIVNQVGSSPRHLGTSMVVRADASIAGTVGGGALEAAAIRESVEAIKRASSTLFDFHLNNNDSANLGMICGGSGVLLIDYISPSNVGARDYFASLVPLLERGGKGWSVSAIPAVRDTVWTSATCLIDSSEQISGSPARDENLLRGLIREGRTAQEPLAGDGSTYFLHSIGLQGAAYVFGAGHCGQKLVSVLSLVDFHTTVVDDRANFANSERFPTADGVLVVDSFEGAVEQLPIDDDSYIVIVTRGHLHDRGVLEQALRTPAAYIGMIGSRKKIAQTFEALHQRGFSDADLARVHSPIGLPIGAETPEEIAVSIAAEMIQTRAARRNG
jgi:xanthine dehydrogenase accessory factor